MKKRNIFCLYAIALLQGMVFYGPIATLYRQAQGVGVLQIALIECVCLVLCLLLELPWGLVADRIGYKRTMIFCCALYFLSKIVFWRADGFAAFLWERVLLSVVIAGLSGVDVAMLYLSCPPGDSQRAFGAYNGLQTAGLLIAALVFSAFIGGDYQLAALLTVLSYGAAALFSLGLVEVKAGRGGRAAPRDFAATLRRALKDKRLLLLLIGVALLNETHQMVTVFLNQLQYVKCGLSDAAIGYLYVAVTLTGLCGVFSARLTRRAGPVRMGALLMAAAAASCALLAFTASAWLSAACVLLLRAAFSLFQPLQTELQNRRVHSGNRATELSLNAMIVDGVGVGTNVAFGALAERSLPGALLLGAGLCAAGALLFAAGNRKLSG